MNDFPENFDLDNKEFKYAEQLILYSNRSIYLTGKAGTGKSTFLRYIAKNTTKNYIIVAPTGIAAINAGGMTINSFFQLPFTPFVWELFDEAQRQGFNNFSKEKREIIQKADLIIIDEISMVRADVIDAIDYRLRNYGGKKHLPFGGKQILFVGDTFQLEPIAQRDEWQILNKYYDSPYFFSARTFKEMNFMNIELKKVYRQSDEKFISLLNKVRVNQAKTEDLIELNKNYTPNFTPNDNDGFITLATKRDIVDATNLQKLNQLEGTLFTFEGIIEGKFGRENSYNDDLLPTNKVLDIKKGAQVMFVKNDRGGRWVNGTIGVIEKISEKSISVTINKKEEKVTYDLDRVSWENVKYEIDKKTGKIIETIIGTFTQYPIKLAWAITIHKSQGLTFDKLVIDMGGGAFSAGHTYVALSRCTSLEGIKLRTPIKMSDIIVRDEVIRLSQTANNESAINNELSDSQANFYYKDCIKEFDNNNFELAYDNLIKAKEFRDDTLKPIFKRFLTYKLNQLKFKNNKFKNLEKANAKLASEIEQLNEKLNTKELKIKEISKELSETQKEMENLYRVVDVKEREERTTASQLQANLKELVVQKEQTNVATQTNNENLIRLENANQIISNLQEDKLTLKSEISNWKKYTVIAVIALFLILILFIIKLVIA
jgi:PIF1-like helicase